MAVRMPRETTDSDPAPAERPHDHPSRMFSEVSRTFRRFFLTKEPLARPLKPGLPRFARNDQLLSTIVIARRNDEAISCLGDFCKSLADIRVFVQIKRAPMGKRPLAGS